MNIITIRELFKNTEQYIDKDVEVCGWVRSVRASKAFGFIVLNDGTFFEPLQVVFHDTMANFEEVSKLNVGSALIVKGKLVATPEAKQAFEIQAVEVHVEGPSTPDYPLQKKRHSLEYLRTISHLRARTNTFQAVFRVRSLIAFAIHSFFMERNFVYVHTPIITGSDCEGAGEMFRVTTLDMASAYTVFPNNGKRYEYRKRKLLCRQRCAPKRHSTVINHKYLYKRNNAHYEQKRFILSYVRKKSDALATRTKAVEYARKASKLDKNNQMVRELIKELS